MPRPWGGTRGSWTVCVLPPRRGGRHGRRDDAARHLRSARLGSRRRARAVRRREGTVGLASGACRPRESSGPAGPGPARGRSAPRAGAAGRPRDRRPGALPTPRGAAARAHPSRSLAAREHDSPRAHSVTVDRGLCRRAPVAHRGRAGARRIIGGPPSWGASAGTAPSWPGSCGIPRARARLSDAAGSPPAPGGPGPGGPMRRGLSHRHPAPTQILIARRTRRRSSGAPTSTPRTSSPARPVRAPRCPTSVTAPARSRQVPRGASSSGYAHAATAATTPSRDRVAVALPRVSAGPPGLRHRRRRR